MKEIVFWLTELHHQNNFRWYCIFLSCMKKLPTAVFEAIFKDYFIMKKEKSCISYYWNGPLPWAKDKAAKSETGANEIFYAQKKLPKWPKAGQLYIIWFLNRIIYSWHGITLKIFGICLYIPQMTLLILFKMRLCLRIVVNLLVTKKIRKNHH